MASGLGGARERLRTWWNENWKIPWPDLGNVLFVFAMLGLFFLWFVLSVTGVEGEAIRAAHRLFPEPFFFVNLFVAPVLAVFVAGPLPIPRVARLVFAVLMLASMSLLVVTRQHQAAGLFMLGFLYLEAFWIIPRWNRWHDRKLGLRLPPAVPARPLKSKLRDYVLYVLAASAVAGYLIYIVMTRR